ncbi:MAG: transporter substrate-binding domain-containing protein [Gammaproteobacteria bacterium]|nr:transporter substrate-binding domain-containing protein [Gammaproteobacteria bacterium]
MRKAWVSLGVLALVALVTSIGVHSLGPPSIPAPEPPPGADVRHPAQPLRGDLADLRARGELRIVSRRGTGGIILDGAERALLEEFARSQGMRTEFIEAETSQLLVAVEDGRADLAAGARDVEVREGVRFTLPWGVSGAQVIGRIGAGRLRNESDLSTRQVAAKVSSRVWGQLKRLAAANPTMDLMAIPEHERIETMLTGISSGRYDLLVADSAQLEGHLSRYPDLEVALDLTAGEPRSWAVRAGAAALLSSLNSFLNRRHLELEAARVYREDLDGLRERRVLRLITVPGPVNYFVRNGRLKGFDYELVTRFAERHRLRVDVVTAGSVDEMRRLLLAGRGDLVAASLPASAAGAAVAATLPYDYAAPVVVARADDRPLVDISDLAGRSILLPAESPYSSNVRALRRSGVNVTVETVTGTMDMGEALARVAAGRSDLTVISGSLVRAEFARQLELRGQFALSEPEPVSWFVRASDRQLLAALDDFVGENYQSGYYKALYSRYVERPAVWADDRARVAGAEAISPYDDIVQKYAAHYDFDWRLILAQMFQESNFDPNAESVAGASGLMQMLPGTAEFIGAGNLDDPRDNIRAGLKYMDFLRSQFEENLNLEDRTWFTLAAYNAGLARVQKARARAAAMNLDPDRWFDNVELAMMSFARPVADAGPDSVACRCGQAVVYVRDIRSRYNSYLHLTRDTGDESAAPSG